METLDAVGKVCDVVQLANDSVAVELNGGALRNHQTASRRRDARNKSDRSPIPQEQSWHAQMTSFSAGFHVVNRTKSCQSADFMLTYPVMASQASSARFMTETRLGGVRDWDKAG